MPEDEWHSACKQASKVAVVLTDVVVLVIVYRNLAKVTNKFRTRSSALKKEKIFVASAVLSDLC